MTDPKTTGSTPRSILIPIDGSSHSVRAFDWYLEQLKRDGDKITFAHVVEPVVGTPGPVVFADIPNLLEQETSKGKILCQKFVTKAKENHVDAHGLVHIEHRPGHTLVKMIDEHKAAVVIMGSRGQNAIRRTFLGSVSDYVLHHAHIPVIIVPPVDQ